MKTNLRYSNICLRALALLCLMMASVGAWAADYVLTYTNGSTTYYLARNGTTGVTRVNTFNPTTCIWSCETAAGAAGTLNNSNTYGYLYQTVNGTKYYLYADVNAFSLKTDRATTNYSRMRTNGTYVYNRYSSTTSYYINLANNAPARNTTASTASNARPYQVTTNSVAVNNNGITAPTISCSGLSGSAGIQLSRTGVGGSYIPAHTTYAFDNQTIYYYNNTAYTNTNQFAVSVNANDATYNWSVTAGTANVSTTGVVTLSNNNTQNVTVRCRATINGVNKDATYTLNATATAALNETAYGDIEITPSSQTLDLGETKTYTVSASISQLTKTRPQYVTVTDAQGHTHYKVGTTYQAAEPTITETPGAAINFTSFSWSAAEGGAYFTLEPYYSASSNQVTLTRSAQKTGTQQTFTISVTGRYGSQSKTASATVTIPATQVDLTALHAGAAINLGMGSSESVNGHYTYEPDYDAAGSPYLKFKYTSNSESVATVDASGKVTAVGPGSTTITVTAVKLDGTDGVTCNVTVNVTIDAPTISIDGSGNVTITHPVPGVQIRYTTDGTDPTATTGTVYTASFAAGNEQTIKAIAVANGVASPVASEFYVASGVSGGKVIINDLQDHNWTLYQGVSSDVDEGHYNSTYTDRLYRPDPRNVKITYYGNSTNNIMNGATTVGTSSNVKVGIDADASTFVYYKTLEKLDDKYTYRTIPNPFSVRPKVGTTYYGFSYWRVKSVTGGTITGMTNNRLEADVEYTFVPTGAYTINGTTMEVELEAVWEPATVITSGTFSNTTNRGSVERNFFIVSGTGAITPLEYPCTYTSLYPNGTTNGTTAATAVTVTKTGTFSAAADSKIEYVILNNGGSFVANARNVTIGRGTRGTGTSATRLLGIEANATNPNFHFRVESGQYDYMSFVGGYYTNTGGNGTNSNSNTITVNNVNNTRIRITMGSDYDRAAGNNDLLQMRYAMSMGRSTTFSQANRTNPHTIDLTIKSGKLGTTQFLETTTNERAYLQGGAGYGHYISCGSTQTYVGRRNVYIEGGEMSTIGSGIDRDNATTNDNGTGRYNVGFLSFYVRMTGGIIHGNLYGGAAFARAGGDKMIIQTGGQIKGWVAAGCNGTQDDGGQTYGESFVYIGGNGIVDSENNNRVLGYANGGNVYAAGAGIEADNSTCGEMSDGSNLVIADDCTVERGIYGGGNYGYTKTSTHTYIYVTGGTNKGVADNATSSKGAVYGGANNQSGPTIKLYMTGGKMLGGVYGGCNTKGTINGSVTMQINGGQVGVGSQTANIHGGGYGNGTIVSGNVDITLGKKGAARDADGVTVWGDVYGGSALGSVNGTAATNTYNTNVTMNAGYIHGSLYGGALGNAGTAANVYGPVQVKVYGGSVMKTDADGRNGSGAVYGCNNINGAPQRAVSVDIYGTNSAPADDQYALYAVYGGGNQASYSYGTPTVTVHNCDNSIEYVYGGGNAADILGAGHGTNVTIWGGNVIGNVFGGGNGTVTAANVAGAANVTIHGGRILNVFGGSNSQGTIGGAINVNVAQEAEAGHDLCNVNIDKLFGGGNEADSKSGNISIGCAEYIGEIYGGANKADIDGNITLEITAGHIGKVFGGNNESGNISGNIKVTVNDSGESCGMEIGNVYGGGNQAAYSIYGYNDGGHGTIKTSGTAVYNNPIVNIENGHLTGSVFGGGLGATAVMYGSPAVTIGANTGTVHIDGNVFGGGDAANVVGKPVVLVQNCNTVIGTKDGEGKWNAVGGTVYGGGNAAHVTGSDNGTSVTINGGDINRVFGGGNGEVSPANVEGNAVTTIHAGNIHQAFAGSNMQGNIGGSASITIDHDGTCDELVDEVYGGGNEAAGSAGAVNIECGAIVGDVYGGANQADVNSDITLNITGGSIDRVFGGNNTSGNITGQITVNVDKGSCELSLGDVFGAGNLAQYAGGPIVNIKNGTVTRNVYGGGKGDPEDHTKGQVTGNPIVTIGDMSKPGSVATVGGDVYGGGDAGNVVGTPQVRVPAKENTTITNVYGGGNAADVNGTDLLIDGGHITGMVFGGGHGSKDDPDTQETEPTVAANVNGNVQLYVTGGSINKVFAGSNANGNITGRVDFQIAKGNTSNEMHISEVYGGGNEAAGNAGTILIGCTGGDSEGIGDVYGGANAADINSDITLTITGGRINNVFGGNNTSGDISGDIEVNVEWNGGCTNSRIGNVYGGGNLAQYSGSPVVNIKNGTISENVYGGGKGDPADHTKGQITGAPVVNIGDNTDAGWVAHVVGDVYGGGDAGNVVGTPHVNIINKCNTIIDRDVYGGGNAADVSSTDVNIDGGTITGMVFGGGHGDLTSEPQKEANVGGDVHVDITGGTIGKVFGGSNSKGTITGQIYLNIDKEDGHCDMHITEVYGGGNLAAGASGNITIGCTGGDSEGIGDVYGGANAADINSDITLTITGGRINNVFGGNNTSGSITGPITVNVDWDDELTCGKYLGDVFGGGNLANYANATEVNMKKGTANHIYGGGNEAGVGSATVNMLGGDVLLGLYGGCNTSGTVTGDIAVNVTGGQVGTDALNKANVHGGGYGSATGSNGNVDVAVSGGVLFGDVYGGSALGNVNGTSADASKHTNVSVSGGTINGDVYGGGLGSKSPLTEAKEYGTVNVTIDPGANITGDVFGCNNAAGAPQGAVNVVVNGTSALQIHNVYGGGNEAAYSGTPSLTVNGCLAVINDLYGGGNAAATGGTNAVVNGGTIARAFGGGNGESGTAADVNGNSSLTIHGGSISQVFGGSNSNGTVLGTMALNIDHTSACEENITDVYGGGNMAPGKVAVLTIGCGAGPFVNVFGGSNNANVSGNIVLNITGGTITNVFGGNNTGGTIDGTVTVNVSGGHLTNVFGENNAGGNVNGKVTVNIEQNDLEDCEHLTLDYVYGGGKDAAYTPTTPGAYPEVNLIKGVVNHDVFGGGLGESATVTSNPTVTMRPTEKANFTVLGNIYGGGSAAPVNGSTSLTINNGTIGTMGSTSPEGGYVFGGGLGQTAVVSGDTRVQVTGNTDVEKNVYGGGNGGEVQGDTKVIIGE